MPSGSFGPGYPATQAQNVAPQASAGSGGASEVSVSAVEGFASANVTIGGVKHTDDVVAVRVNNLPVSYTVLSGDADLAAIATGLMTAVNASVPVGALVVASKPSSVVVQVKAKSAGAAGMLAVSATYVGSSVTAVASGSLLDLAGNAVIPTASAAVALPGGGAITLYTGIPVSVDPGTKTFLRSKGLIA